MPLVTCNESVCNLPHKVDVTVETKISAFNVWQNVHQATPERFTEIVADRALIKTSDLFQCDVGIETIKTNGNTAKLRVAHNCPVHDRGFTETVQGMIQILNDEIEESPTGLDVEIDEKGNPYLSGNNDRQIIPILHDVGKCSVFIPRWISPDGHERRILVPTRQCLDHVQSALSSINITLKQEPHLWEGAKTSGEKVVVDEDIIGSYLFYRLKGKHPLSMDTCQELFDHKVIDGANFRYSTPKTKSPDIPVDIKENLEKLIPEHTAKGFAQRIERFVEDKRLQLSRRGGACEIITQPLKDSEEISKNWVWFGDGDSLLIFNPTDLASILKNRGYDVTINPWKQTIERAPLVKVEGLSCSLRDYQVDPICRWTKRVGSTLATTTPEPKIDWEYAQDQKTKILNSYTPEPALGGIIKAPTGAGKTIIGLVTLATQGMGVPQAEEVVQ